MLPAILCNNKLVTGLHHGDAFSKLTEQEKDSEMLSGFIDNLKFICDDRIIYLKEIILMRHGESDSQENGSLTEKGRSQTQKAATFLFNMNLQGFIGISSPYIRCQQTSRLLHDICEIDFHTDRCLSKKNINESNENFQHRMSLLLDELPAKSILITHTDFIQNILALINLITEQIESVDNCSITYIYNNRLIWLAKNVE